MITESKHELFVMLCEGILLESTIINLLDKSPRAIALAKQIYKTGKILHNSPFVKTNRVEGGLARMDARIDYHYLIIGENNDFLYLSTKGNRGGNFNFIYIDRDMIVEEHTVMGLVAAKKYTLDKIGKIKRIYQYTRTMDTKQDITHRERINKRLKGKTIDGYVKYDVDYLAKKFKPMFLKTLKMAENEMKGMLMTMIRNGYYNEAKTKVEKVKNISSLIYSYEQDSKSGRHFFEDKINIAIRLTSQYVYPDLFAESVHRADEKLLESLTQGNMQNLSYILSFFKNIVIRGIS